METVLALLPSSQAASQTIDCCRLSENGQVACEIWSADTLQVHKGTQCIVVLPASCLSWTEVTLPPQFKLRGNARLVPVLQNLVEEVLLDDAQSMHLALPPDARIGSTLTLAVCERAWLARWMQSLEQAGIKVIRVIPEFAPDMLGEHLWACGQGHDVWITGLHGSTVLTVPIESALAIFGTTRLVKALPMAYKSASKLIGETQVQLVSHQDWIQAQLQTRWNLAQHDLAGAWAQRIRRKQAALTENFFYAHEWRSARIACMTLGIGLALILNVQAWRQKQALHQQREAIVETVQQTFPNLTVVIDAQLQMQRELQRLRREAGVFSSGDFEPMAAAMGTALRKLNLQASAVQYKQGQLLLEGVPTAQLSAVNQQLANSGYWAEIEGNSILMQEGR